MFPETGHCPVTANMSFDSHLVVSHVVLTAHYVAWRLPKSAISIHRLIPATAGAVSISRTRMPTAVDTHHRTQ
jgi:hypothetical protein